MSSAERQRLRRWRKKNGIKVVTVEVGLDHLDALVDLRLLEESDEERPGAVAIAVQDLIDTVTEEYISRHASRSPKPNMVG